MTPILTRCLLSLTLLTRCILRLACVAGRTCAGAASGSGGEPREEVQSAPVLWPHGETLR